ncbi:hypothetical protein [Brachybacterium sp. ACRRE]|uniref:hypothetical protein n=1 Tax=Brachybacterium sp. ACRRE TaxID=2918184 RepID=UPI001EF2E6D4|nr:hypothetical protein [Brachybacterium sp. ACRRE]MCG7308211.1 hypothetical protein [Brachybacterium sp. ACRRE]
MAEGAVLETPARSVGPETPAWPRTLRGDASIDAGTDASTEVQALLDASAEELLELVSTARVMLRTTVVDGARTLHSRIALAPGVAISCLHEEHDDRPGPTLHLRVRTGDHMLAGMLAGMPDAPELRAAPRIADPTRPWHVLTPEQLEMLARAAPLHPDEPDVRGVGGDDDLVDALCHERVRLTAALHVRDASRSELVTGWNGLWVLGERALHTLRVSTGSHEMALRRVVPGDIAYELTTRTAAAFHTLGALERERAELGAGTAAGDGSRR